MALLSEKKENNLLHDALLENIIYLSSFKQLGEKNIPRCGLGSGILSVLPIFLYDHHAFEQYSKGFATEGCIFINAKHFKELLKIEKTSNGYISASCGALVQAVYEFLNKNSISKELQEIINKNFNSNINISEKSLGVATRKEKEKIEPIIQAHITEKDFFYKLKENNELSSLESLYGPKADDASIEKLAENSKNSILTIINKYLNYNFNSEYDVEIKHLAYKQKTTNNIEINETQEKAKKDWECDNFKLTNSWNIQDRLKNIIYCKKISDIVIEEIKLAKNADERKKVFVKFGNALTCHSDETFSNAMEYFMSKLKETPQFLTKEKDDYLTIPTNLKEEIAYSINESKFLTKEKKNTLIKVISGYLAYQNEAPSIEKYNNHTKTLKP